MRPRLDAVVIIVRAARTLGVTCLGFRWESGEDEKRPRGVRRGRTPTGRDWVVYMSFPTFKYIQCFNINVSTEKNPHNGIFSSEQIKNTIYLVEHIK